MKYEVVSYRSRHFTGIKRLCDLNKPEEMCIGELWSELWKDISKVPMINNEPCIGLEKYPCDFHETKQFDYFALVPVSKDVQVPGYEKVTLPEGNYVRVEITWGELLNGTTPKVYEFLQTTDLEIDYGFDYEEYPCDIDLNNPESIMYIVLKLKD